MSTYVIESYDPQMKYEFQMPSLSMVSYIINSILETSGESKMELFKLLLKNPLQWLNSMLFKTTIRFIPPTIEENPNWNVFRINFAKQCESKEASEELVLILTPVALELRSSYDLFARARWEIDLEVSQPDNANSIIAMSSPQHKWLLTYSEGNLFLSNQYSILQIDWKTGKKEKEWKHDQLFELMDDGVDVFIVKMEYFEDHLLLLLNDFQIYVVDIELLRKKFSLLSSRKIKKHHLFLFEEISNGKQIYTFNIDHKDRAIFYVMYAKDTLVLNKFELQKASLPKSTTPFLQDKFNKKLKDTLQQYSDRSLNLSILYHDNYVALLAEGCIKVYMKSTMKILSHSPFSDIISFSWYSNEIIIVSRALNSGSEIGIYNCINWRELISPSKFDGLLKLTPNKDGKVFGLEQVLDVENSDSEFHVPNGPVSNYLYDLFINRVSKEVNKPLIASYQLPNYYSLFYTFMSFNFVKPSEQLASYLSNHEYQEALKIALEHGYNLDLILKKQWDDAPKYHELFEPITIANLSTLKLLTMIKDEKWILSRCLNTIGDSPLSMKEIIRIAIRITTKLLLQFCEARKFSTEAEAQKILNNHYSNISNIPDEELFLISIRYTFVKWMKLLETYTESSSIYNWEEFIQISRSDIFEFAIEMATRGNVSCIITMHHHNLLSNNDLYQFIQHLPLNLDIPTYHNLLSYLHQSKGIQKNLDFSEILMNKQVESRVINSEDISDWLHSRVFSFENYGKHDQATSLVKLGMDFGYFNTKSDMSWVNLVNELAIDFRWGDTITPSKTEHIVAVLLQKCPLNSIAENFQSLFEPFVNVLDTDSFFNSIIYPSINRLHLFFVEQNSTQQNRKWNNIKVDLIEILFNSLEVLSSKLGENSTHIDMIVDEMIYKCSSLTFSDIDFIRLVFSTRTRMMSPKIKSHLEVGNILQKYGFNYPFHYLKNDVMLNILCKDIQNELREMTPGILQSLESCAHPDLSTLQIESKILCSIFSSNFTNEFFIRLLIVWATYDTFFGVEALFKLLQPFTSNFDLLIIVIHECFLYSENHSSLRVNLRNITLQLTDLIRENYTSELAEWNVLLKEIQSPHEHKNIIPSIEEEFQIAFTNELLPPTSSNGMKLEIDDAKSLLFESFSENDTNTIVSILIAYSEISMPTIEKSYFDKLLSLSSNEVQMQRIIDMATYYFALLVLRWSSIDINFSENMDTLIHNALSYTSSKYALELHQFNSLRKELSSRNQLIDELQAISSHLDAKLFLSSHEYRIDFVKTCAHRLKDGVVVFKKILDFISSHDSLCKISDLLQVFLKSTFDLVSLEDIKYNLNFVIEYSLQDDSIQVIKDTIYEILNNTKGEELEKLQIMYSTLMEIDPSCETTRKSQILSKLLSLGGKSFGISFNDVDSISKCRDCKVLAQLLSSTNVDIFLDLIQQLVPESTNETAEFIVSTILQRQDVQLFQKTLLQQLPNVRFELIKKSIFHEVLSKQQLNEVDKMSLLTMMVDVVETNGNADDIELIKKLYYIERCKTAISKNESTRSYDVAWYAFLSKNDVLIENAILEILHSGGSLQHVECSLRIFSEVYNEVYATTSSTDPEIRKISSLSLLKIISSMIDIILSCINNAEYTANWRTIIAENGDLSNISRSILCGWPPKVKDSGLQFVFLLQKILVSDSTELKNTIFQQLNQFASNEEYSESARLFVLSQLNSYTSSDSIATPDKQYSHVKMHQIKTKCLIKNVYPEATILHKSTPSENEWEMELCECIQNNLSQDQVECISNIIEEWSNEPIFIDPLRKIVLKLIENVSKDIQVKLRLIVKHKEILNGDDFKLFASTMEKSNLLLACKIQMLSSDASLYEECLSCLENSRNLKRFLRESKNNYHYGELLTLCCGNGYSLRIITNGEICKQVLQGRVSFTTQLEFEFLSNICAEAREKKNVVLLSFACEYISKLVYNIPRSANTFFNSIRMLRFYFIQGIEGGEHIQQKTMKFISSFIDNECIQFHD